MIKGGAIFCCIVAVAIGIHQLQTSIDDRRRTEIAPRSLMYLPDGEVLKLASLGYKHVVADLVWLRVIQVFGSRHLTQDDYNWIYHALDVTTTLDPQFVEAYLAGGLALTVIADHVDQSNRILKKGIEANVQNWKIPFFLGFNYFNFLHDYEAAATYIEMATEIPGHPSWLPLLAARLHVQAQAPHVALEFLGRIYDGTSDPWLKAKLEIRMKEVIIEQDLMALERAIDTYQSQFGELPKSLERLAETGIIGGIRPDPFGEAYAFDPLTGEVTSRSMPERMHVYHPPGQKEIDDD